MSMRPFDGDVLAGRVAIVTGASSGLGARFAAVLAAAGAQVVAVARRREPLEQLAAEHKRITAYPADITDDDVCSRLVADAVLEHGTIDVLVNNAGMTDGPVPAEVETPAQFRSVVDLNLNATFVLSSLVGSAMLKRGRGCVINVSSVHGLVGSAPNKQAGYAASKAAVVNLTRELALQWADRGVRVNAIAPGYFVTELTEQMFVGDDQSGGRWVERNTPLRRPGRPEELDGALLFLASDASSYVTGQTLAVDGGWTSR